MSYYFVKQHDQADCGAACLAMILGNLECKLPLSKLRHDIRTDADGSTIYGILRAAEKYGLKGEALCGSFEEFKDSITKGNVTLPLIVNVASPEGYSHFIVIYKIRGKRCFIADPAKYKTTCALENLREIWLGTILCFSEENTVVKTDELAHSMDKYIIVCRRQSKFFVAVIIFSLFITVISMIGTLVFEYIVDGIYSGTSENVLTTNEGNSSADTIILHYISLIFPTLPKLCAVMVCFFLFRSMIGLLRSYFSAIMGKRIDRPVMMSFFECVIHAPMTFFHGRRVGDILSRFSDASGVCQGISGIVLTAFIDGFLMIAYGIFLFGISAKLFIVVLISSTLYSVVVMIFKERLQRNKMDMLQKSADVSSYMKESVDGIETIRLFRYEQNAANKFYHRFSALLDKSFEGTMLGAWQTSIVGFISSVSIVAVLWVGDTLCRNGALQAGSLITFYMMTGSFIEPLQGLISLQPQIQSIKVSAERLNDVFEQEYEVHAEPDNIKNDAHKITRIDLKDLNFAYGYRTPVLNDASFSLKRGERIAVLGKNGSGKTTLANILMGLYRPDNVKFFINGNEVSPEEYDIYANKIAYIPQESFFFSESILDNLLFGLSLENISEELFNKVIHQCGLDEYLSTAPQGIYTCLEENGSNLSAGTKQKLAIARALLREPEILIMDESTSNIDVESENEIHRMLDELGRHITIIDISHKIRDLNRYDSVYQIEGTKLISKKAG